MGSKALNVKEDPVNKEKKDAQNRAIRDRLADYYDSLDENTRPSVYTLQKELADRKDGFIISYNTLNELLCKKKQEDVPVPNLHLVLALCRYWNLDYATILAPPESDEKPVPYPDALVEKSQVLDDSDYHGVFHGYMYTKNKGRQEIVYFELRIQPEGNTVIAQMRTHSTTEKVDGELKPRSVIYTGVPIILTKPKTVYMVLTNREGNSYILYFDYRHYENGLGMYYRKGVALAIESTSGKPLVTNFLLFQNKVGQDKVKKYIPGLLRFVDEKFIIEDKAIEQLRKEDDMKEFFKRYEYNWEKKTITGYRVIFEHVIKSIDNPDDDAEVIRVMNGLFRMLEKSESPIRYDYDNPPGMPKYAKTYLQRNVKVKENDDKIHD